MPTWFVYIGSFVVVLGVIIFVHEMGHFLAAKAVGIHVHRFSLGIGRPIRWLTFRWRETEYCVSWLPLGGYVKMAGMGEEGSMAELEGGEAAEAAKVPPERTFDHKSLPARALVISAGVAMNFLFAVVAHAVLAGTVGRAVDPTTRVDSVVPEALPDGAEPLLALERGDRITAVGGRSVGSWNDIQEGFRRGGDSLVFDVAGKPSLTLHIPGYDLERRLRAAAALAPLHAAVIGGVTPGTPAARAGFAAGDTVLAISGDTVQSWGHMAALIRPRAGDTLTIALLNNAAVREVAVVPEAGLGADPRDTTAVSRGAIGISLALDIERIQEPPLRAVRAGAEQMIMETSLVLRTLQGLVMRPGTARQLGGPILIGQMSGQVAQLGLPSFVAFMAFLSVNIAVLNLLPIPVLDGGHLVFLGIEAVRRRPLTSAMRVRFDQVGMLLLIGIVLWAFWNDLSRIFGG
jgi:regulator of sigma E protease